MKFSAKIFTESVSNQNLDGYTTSASFNSNPVPVHGVYGYSVSFVFPSTGSPAGTVKLQVSNDLEANPLMLPDSKVVNWTDVPNQSITVTTAGGNGIIETCTMSRWLRLVYTRSSGSITATAVIHFKSMT